MGPAHATHGAEGFLSRLLDKYSQEYLNESMTQVAGCFVGSEVRPVFFLNPLWVRIGDRWEGPEFLGFSRRRPTHL